MHRSIAIRNMSSIIIPRKTRQKVRINTDYYQNDNVMMLCKSYDRGLCDAIEEYEKLNLKYIESQAYGSWMDGAR